MTVMYGDIYEFLEDAATTVVETENPEFVDLIEAGPSGGSGGGHYTHTQSVAAATWTVSHNLNAVRDPAVVLDSEPDRIVYPDVTVVDLNTISISFDSAVTGKAYL